MQITSQFSHHRKYFWWQQHKSGQHKSTHSLRVERPTKRVVENSTSTNRTRVNRSQQQHTKQYQQCLWATQHEPSNPLLSCSCRVPHQINLAQSHQSRLLCILVNAISCSHCKILPRVTQNTTRAYAVTMPRHTINTRKNRGRQHTYCSHTTTPIKRS